MPTQTGFQSHPGSLRDLSWAPFCLYVYAQDLPDYATNGSTLALFADDSKLCRTMVSHLSPVILQHDLDGLFRWSMDWHMTFNVAKCKTLHFSKKKFPTDQSQYHLGGQPLERVLVIKDLGVSVCCDLQWGRHIAEIASKSNKILGLIKRVCKDMSNTQKRKVLCYTLIRPRQEYCCSLWSPHTAKDRALIKNVQRRATKFILNYPHDCCYVDRLTSLKLLLLEYRREAHDLTLLFKLKCGLMNTDYNKILYSSNSPL